MQYVRTFSQSFGATISIFAMACAGSDETPDMVSPTTTASVSAAPSVTSNTSATNSTTSAATSTVFTSSTSSSSSSATSTAQNTATPQTTSNATGPTFSADIHPILTAKCSGPSCHSGDFFDKYAMPDVDVAYQAANAEGDKIVMRTGNGTMPMGVQCLDGGTWSTDPKCLTEAERALIEEWVSAGTPL